MPAERGLEGLADRRQRVFVIERLPVVPVAAIVQSAQGQGLEEVIADFSLLHLLALDQDQPVGLEVVDRKQVGNVLVGEEAEKRAHGEVTLRWP